MRILIVEDERALCDAIARSLRNLAYSVDCCHDGRRRSTCWASKSLTSWYSTSTFPYRRHDRTQGT